MIVGKGGAYFSKKKSAMPIDGHWDREIVAFWSLADSNNKKMSSIQKKSTVDTDNKLKFETPKEKFFKRIA